VDIDLEKPEFQSPSHSLFVYSTLLTSDRASTLFANISLEVHARYHRPSNKSSSALVEIPAPDVFYKCCDAEIDKMVNTGQVDDITWTQLECTYSHANDGVITFDVPVGQLHDFNLVVYGTLAITIGTTLWLIVTLLRASLYIY